jgi:hypothetical protein
VHGRAVLIRDCRDDVLLADATLDADARKIVLSVNALPLVDALIEAVDALASEPGRTGRTLPAVFAARDALEAALRGEGE